MYDFDRLERACKRYYLKRYMALFGAVVLFGTALYFAALYFFMQEPAKQLKQQTKQVQTPHSQPLKKQKAKESLTQTKKAPLPKTDTNVKKDLTQKKQPPKKSALGCFAIQFYATKNEQISALIRYKEKLESYGLECYTYEKENISKLRCNKTNNYADILKTEQEIQKHKIKEYFVVQVDCSNMKETKEKPLLTQPKPEAKKTKQEPKKQITNMLQLRSIDINRLLKQFQLTHNYTTALEISRYYLQEKQFQNALKWAQKANKIDKEDPASWILYAKALKGLGYKNKAIKLLKSYEHYHYSQEIDLLIKQLQKDSL